MSKPIKIALWIIGSLVIIGLLFVFLAGPLLKKNTKKHSPEVSQTFTFGDLEIDLFYSSPSKKGRMIFGELVPYDEVWRTGANEATKISTNKDLLIDGKTLPAGEYTLWTIPGEQQWEIIFNDKMYPWGVRWQDSKAMREPEHDRLVTTAKVSESATSQENFSIRVLSFSERFLALLLVWDHVVVSVPMEVK